MIYSSQRQLIRSILTPNLICTSIFDIPLATLVEKGYKTLLLDVDNTLVGIDDRDPTLRTVNWIIHAKGLGLSVHIVSNNRNFNRIRRICDHLDIEGLYRAWKPFPWAIRSYAAQQRIQLNRCIMVGDQLFTDVILGNWIRGYSVLVDPMDKRLSLIKTIQRELELALVRVLT